MNRPVDTAHGAGSFTEAERLYRKIVHALPDQGRSMIVQWEPVLRPNLPLNFPKAAAGRRFWENS